MLLESNLHNIRVHILIENTNLLTSLYLSFRTTQPYRLYINFCLVLLLVSAICYSHHQVGILFHENSKKLVEASPEKSGCNVDVKFMNIF